MSETSFIPATEYECESEEMLAATAPIHSTDHQYLQQLATIQGAAAAASRNRLNMMFYQTSSILLLSEVSFLQFVNSFVKVQLSLSYNRQFI